MMRMASLTEANAAAVADGRRWRVRIPQLVRAPHALALADQGIVSASAFLVFLFIGRATSSAELGLYALALSVLALLIAIQESLIMRPYSVELYRKPDTDGSGFGALVLSMALGATATMFAALVALLCTVLGADHTITDVIWAFGFLAPALLLREFGRKFSFAHLKVSDAVLWDGVSALLALSIIAGLARYEKLSVVSGLVAVGLANGIAGCGWLLFRRRQFRARYSAVRAGLRRSWELGRWLLSTHVATEAQGYAAHWAAMLVGGVAATGIYAACLNVLGLSNPVVFGIYNLLGPRSALVFANEGGAGLRRQTLRDTTLLLGLLAMIFLPIGWWSTEILHLVYRGSDYVGSGHVLAVLGGGLLARAIGGPAAIALVSADRARLVAGITAVAAILNAALVLALMPRYGLVGAAYGMLLAAAVGSLARWIALLTLVANDAPQAARGKEAAAPC
jgi:O-antigen/teichoic acid export membrane protein